jgi:hypothetical protein
MRRYLFAAAPLALLLLTAACDGDKKNDDDANADQAEQQAEPTLPPAGQNEPTPVPDKPLPTPSPVPDGAPVIQVLAKGTMYAPVRSEFAALPKEKISASGKEYEGVTLAALAEKAGAADGTIVTIQGTRLDNLRNGAIRFGLSEIGASTVLVINDQGHVLLASNTVPPEQWLKDITGIAFN